jgi:ABC-2 type transport system ATP-binding protein
MTAAAVGELASHRAVTVHELVPLRASLEDAFMELTRDAVELHTQGAS